MIEQVSFPVIEAATGNSNVFIFIALLLLLLALIGYLITKEKPKRLDSAV